ncbi:hypothetical protein OPIT5_10080 [Opitutaceae bacterium TAV5]|nr:hypothetical protein OPIT5_10080 [Opitutaceae bacterium TAV5]
MLFEHEVKPIVVGGQAVNLWAIAYLEDGDPLIAATKYGSGDMDVLQENRVIEMLRNLPGWQYEKTPIWSLSLRRGQVHGRSPDGRRLLVEVLTKVNGLEKTDIECATVEHAGVVYQLLDPIALLKAKAANVRTLRQDDDPPRHDREHLRLVARCFPLYLRDMVAGAVGGDQEDVRNAKVTISRAFAVLQDSKTARVLLAEGISPASLMPPELADCPIEPIRRAYQHQMPRLLQAG